MSEDPFKSGSTGGSGITEYDGSLLLVTPTEYVTDIKTVHGEADAVRVDFVVLDAEGGPEVVEDSLCFQRMLISAMKKQAQFNEKHDVDPKTGFPKMTLGVLKQDTDLQKKGQSAPWVLAEPSDAQKAVARQYLEGLKAEPEDPFASAA